ncbi:MAG: hypothetical protein AB198_01985 [Parcubacteria bacterium C7867-003]|nr:MAG: hypothetical protein AB198_01985 [Parcubacteria bacterium C7867-003]
MLITRTAVAAALMFSPDAPRGVTETDHANHVADLAVNAGVLEAKADIAGEPSAYKLRVMRGVGEDCAMCTGPISKARRNAIPDTIICRACKEELDRERALRRENRFFRP